MRVLVCFSFSWVILVNCVTESTVKDFTSAVEQVLQSDLVFAGLLPSETWIKRNGFIEAGGDVREKESMTLEAAKKICMSENECISLCVNSPAGFPKPNQIIAIDFKNKSNFHEHKDWWTLIKPASQVVGKVTNPLAISRAVLYALRNAQEALENLPYVLGNNERRKLARLEEKMQRHTLRYTAGDSVSLGVLKVLWVDIKRYLRSRLMQAYFEAVGDQLIPAPADHGIGLPFLPKSVDCDSRKTITLLKGVEMPRVGFGTWKLQGQIAFDSVLIALRTGYRHIDTAQSYENEIEVGRAIKAFLGEQNDVTREDLFITTKLSKIEDFGAGKTRTAFLQQLKNLDLDYVDVYMIHKPKTLDVTLEAWEDMEKLYEEDKIRALGLSNFDGPLLDKFLPNVKYRPVYIQNKFDIYTQGLKNYTGESLVQRAMKERIAIAAYSTLNMYPFFLPPIENSHVLKIGAKLGRTPAQVLLRWALQLGCAVLPRSTNEGHIIENFQLFDFALSEQQMFILNRVYQMSSLNGADGLPETIPTADDDGTKTEL